MKPAFSSPHLITDMTTLLIFESSWHRVRSDLARLPPHSPLVLGADGVVRDGDGSPVPDSDVSPNAAWLNIDVWAHARFPQFEKLVRHAPQLHWLQSSAAGTDMPFIQSVLQKGARLCTSHVQAGAMAESVLGRILGQYQRERERARAQAERRWQVLPFRELSGSTWLIVGFGAIGQAVAKVARPFGVHIIGVRRTAGSHPAADRMISPAELEAWLPLADVVVLCLPQEANSGLFDACMLGAMKQGSVLINVARGPIVDEKALVAALDRGTLDHAILDVFQTEPLPEADPLWDHPKVTISAHSAAMGAGIAARGDALFVDNFGRYLRGETLRWEYERPVGPHGPLPNLP